MSPRSWSACGLAWRHYRFHHKKVFTFQELYLFGVGVHAGMILCMFLLPREAIAKTIAALALPVIAIYPVCTALLGSLLAKRRKRLLLEEELGESARRYNQLAAQSRTVTWEADSKGVYTYVSPLVESVLGYRPKDLLGKMHIYDIDPSIENLMARRQTFEELVAYSGWRPSTASWSKAAGTSG